MNRGTIRIGAALVAFACGIIAFIKGDEVTGVGLVAAAVGLLS